MRRIEAAGAYAPRLRIDADEIREAWGSYGGAGVESKAVPDADEDALTMAVAAGRRALDAADRDGSEAGWLGFATTTPPLEEEDLTARLGSALGLPESVESYTFTGSTRAGVQALAAGLEADTEGVGLVTAADAPCGAPESDEEHAAGAGGAAFVLSAERRSAEQSSGQRPRDAGDGAGVTARADYTEPYPGTRFRQGGDGEVQGLGVTQYDRDAYRTALSGAVDGLDADAADVDAAALGSPDGKLPYRAADALDLDAEQVRAAATVHDLGDTGAASAPLGLARALEDGASRALVVGYGSGASATALVVEEGDRVAVDADLAGDVSLTYAEYLRRRGDITSGPPEGGGAYVSVPSWKRTIPSRHRLVAGRCLDCGAVNFPPEGACRDCGGLSEYERIELSRSGTVEAATVIAGGGAPPEFAEQVSRSGAYGSAIVEFESPDGRAVSVPVQVVLTGDESVAAGDAVRAVFRRVYTQEDVPRYGLKVVLAGDE